MQPNNKTDMKNPFWLRSALVATLLSTQIAAVSAPAPAKLAAAANTWRDRKSVPFAADTVQRALAQPRDGLDQQQSASAADERMVFESYRDGNYEIYASDSDGNTPVRLTNDPVVDRFPKLRTGAVSIGFVRGASGARVPMTIRKDASNIAQHSATAGYRDLAWSGDGSILSMVLAPSGQLARIFSGRFDIKTNAYTDVTCRTCDEPFTGRSAVEPAWSPDSRFLYFILISATEPKGSLWRMNADGTAPVQLSAEYYYMSDLRISPDGTQAAWDYAADPDGWQRIGIGSTSGPGFREVYNPGQDLVDAWMGDWSPDGQQLYFTRVEFERQDDRFFIKNTWIERVNSANGQGRVRLPGNTGLDAMPSVEKRDTIAPVTRVNRTSGLWRVTEPLPVAASDAGGSGLDIVKTYGTARLDQQPQVWSELIPFNGGTLNTSVIYARSIGTDLEGNIEQPPANPSYDAALTPYFFAIAGQVLDERSIPPYTAQITHSVNAISSVTSNASASDARGRYQIFSPRSPQGAPERLEVFAAGYGRHPGSKFTATSDIDMPAIHLLPTDDVIRGGQFEIDSSDTAHWLIEKSQLGLNVRVIAEYSDAAPSGRNAAKLSLGYCTCWISGTAISMTQQVTVPATMHKPTLAFYNVFTSVFGTSNPNPPGTFAGLEVEVAEGLTRTIVYSAEVDTQGLRHAWVDMDAWRGKTVQLTFRLRDGVPDKYNGMAVILDQITLGSWRTPVITGLSQSALPALTAGTAITITGQNFIQTPSVFLGTSTQEVTARWIDENTLVADLPALSPGLYDVKVVQPSGQAAVLPQAIRVGRQMYLPITSRL
jgi:hypothetical protein